ncbi:MAG: NusA-like transcription termination signal-binding factor [Candidatus Altiarchaeota archaeon]
MNKIRLTTDDIKHITLFESMTGAKVKDFLQEGDTLCFLVKAGDMGLAIGKKGGNVEKARTALGKNILIFEHNDDEEQFIRNLFTPVEIHGLNIAQTSDNKVAVVEISRADRSKAIGHNGTRIKAAKALTKRHSNIDELTLRTV